jgi:hypothetical protein
MIGGYYIIYFFGKLHLKFLIYHAICNVLPIFSIWLMYHTNLSLAMQCLSSAIENSKNIRIKIIFFLRNEKDKKKKALLWSFFFYLIFFF